MKVKIVQERRYSKAYEKLTEQEQYQLSQLLQDIRFGHTTRGTHEEKIRTANSRYVTSYRVNDDLRLIAYKWKPSELLLLDVGHHQSVYRRVERLKLVDNGIDSLPTFEEEIVSVARQVPVVVPEQGKYGFLEVPRQKVLELGVPEECVDGLMKVSSEDELLEFAKRHKLHDDLVDTLIDVADDSRMIDEYIGKMQRKSVEGVLKSDTNSRARYILITPELEDRFYSGKLENWQVYLHPDQQSAVTIDADGPVMVKGPAGTGKTVVAVHRVKWLLNKFKNGERILFTTYTKTLVSDAKRMLEQILEEYEMKRVDVMTFDSLIHNYWGKIGKGRIVFTDKSGINVFDALISRIVEQRGIQVSRTSEFIGDEFKRIILEYNVRSLEQYKKIQRPKLYGLLQSKEREKLWPIFAELNRVVDGNKLEEYPRAAVYNKVADCFRLEGRTLTREYGAIVVDEVQDLGASEYRLLAALTGNTMAEPQPNSLYLAGDGHQRIYGRCGTLKECGINVPGARSLTLKQCYRSTQLIREYAERIIRGIHVSDPDGQLQYLHGNVSICMGDSPQEKFFEGPDYEQMNDLIAETIREWMKNGAARYSDYAVLMRQAGYGNKRECFLYNTAKSLRDHGIPAIHLSNNVAINEENAVSVMTMHRAKGLQFYGVVVITDNWPHRSKRGTDEEERVARLDQEKCLLYMALMRATSKVLVVGRGKRPCELG